MSWNREDKHRRFARLAVCCMVVLWGGCLRIGFVHKTCFLPVRFPV